MRPSSGRYVAYTPSYRYDIDQGVWREHFIAHSSSRWDDTSTGVDLVVGDAVAVAVTVAGTPGVPCSGSPAKVDDQRV